MGRVCTHGHTVRLEDAAPVLQPPAVMHSLAAIATANGTASVPVVVNIIVISVALAAAAQVQRRRRRPTSPLATPTIQ